MPVKLFPTRHTNLVKTASGVFYVRATVKGRFIRKCLHTDQEDIALLRLQDRINRAREMAGPAPRRARGLMSECIAGFLAQSKASPKIKPRTKDYHKEAIGMIRRSWPDIDTQDAGRITKQNCAAWAKRFRTNPTIRGVPVSPGRFNGTLDTLRSVFAVAIDRGFRYDNPTVGIERMPTRMKQLQLPSADEFQRLLEYIGKPKLSKTGKPLPYKSDAGELVRFLAYSGARINEAWHVQWADVSLERGEILLRKTKNGQERRVPMIAEMKEFLTALKANASTRKRKAYVLQIRSIKRVLRDALVKLGIAHLTHHDLRHLFATRCIESGVDIPTVARWLGHKDGGALAMKVYGHLRDEHSKTMAGKVSFGVKATC